MTGYGKNSEALGAVLLLLLLSGRQDYGMPGKRIYHGGLGLSSLLKELRLGDFARDMHRITDMVDQMSSLGQMAGLLQSQAAQSLLPQPQPAQSHVSGAVNALSNSLPQSLPDMQQLMELAGPLMAMLGNGEKK